MLKPPIIVLLLLFATLPAERNTAADDTPWPVFSIDADFPGGNISVEKIERDRVWLHQDERDTPRFWFYWCFRVRGAQGQTLTFTFTKGNVFGTRGPAVSVDGGNLWDWLGQASIQGDSFRYSFGANRRDVRFAFAIPYTQANLRAFLGRYAGNSAIRCDQLVTTRRRHSVELLRAGRLDGRAQHRILLTCRHHACESIANFVLEGLLEAVLDETETGRWCRDQVEVLAVPFVDKDGVEAGDQGKLRKPHDHWLDYEGKSLYDSTAALRAFFERDRRLPVDGALDLHCPYIRDSRIHFALGSDPRIAAETVRFCRLFEQRQLGPLVYHARDNLSFGSGWNVTATYAGRRSFWQWAQTLPKAQIVSTLEIPYASIGNVTVTPQAARRIGHDLIAAFRAYFETATR